MSATSRPKLDTALKNSELRSPRKPPKGKRSDDILVPPEGDWRTTDDDEINRRRLRAREEAMKVANLMPEEPLFADFRVTSDRGLAYLVQIHDVRARRFSCTCMDFRVNGLGVCKHTEAVLWHLQRRLGKNWTAACERGSNMAEIVLDRVKETFKVLGARRRLPARARSMFLKDGALSSHWTPEAAHEMLESVSEGAVRQSLLIPLWLERRRHARERITLRRDYEQAIVNGVEPPQVTLMPLFPYQREGMLHLAFSERALLADEMGLGKTIQAIAACALLRHLGRRGAS